MDGARDKVAVTGGASGIGEATERTPKRAGWTDPIDFLSQVE